MRIQKSWKMLPISFLFALAVCAPGVIAAPAQNLRACTREQAKQAEQSIDSVTSWKEAYTFFNQYGHCDDGGIAEGISDKVAILLTKHWEKFDEFVKYSRRSSSFERFVLKHIDTLMSPHQAKVVVENVKTRCPSDAEKVCEKVLEKTLHPDE
jgi:hypothetical protein